MILEQKRFPKSMPLHSGLSLLSEHYSGIGLNGQDSDASAKLLCLKVGLIDANFSNFKNTS